VIGTVVLILRLLLAAALYVFLGLAIWYIWSQLKQTTDRIASGQVPSIRLATEDAGSAAVERTFSRAEVIIGRDPRADIALKDGSASSRHAHLSFHHGQWWVVDLGSKNGTKLNRLPIAGPTVLADGDEIRCGQSRVHVHLVEAAQARQMGSGVSDE
jgi:pSer/pThr/pTyr-binding forkhead associated (FHA) protein